MLRDVCSYTYVQKGINISLTVWLPANVNEDDLIVNLLENEISIKRGGEVFIEGNLHLKIQPGNSSWKLDQEKDHTILKINLQKKPENQRVRIWEQLLRIPVKCSVPEGDKFVNEPTNILFGTELKLTLKDVKKSMEKFYTIQKEFLLAKSVQKVDETTKSDALKVFEEGRELAVSPEKSRVAFEKYMYAANRGCENAQVTVAEILISPTLHFAYGQKRDVNKGIEFYKMAVYQNFSGSAAHTLGLFYERAGKGQRAIELGDMFMTFSAILGHVQACLHLGRNAERNGHIDTAMEWFSIGMRRGCSKCAYELGSMCVKQKDDNRARLYYMLASQWNPKLKLPPNFTLPSVGEEIEKPKKAQPEEILQNVLKELDQSPIHLSPLVVEKDDPFAIDLDESDDENENEQEEESESEPDVDATKLQGFIDNVSGKREERERDEGPAAAAKEVEEDGPGIVETILPHVLAWGIIGGLGYYVYKKMK